MQPPRVIGVGTAGDLCWLLVLSSCYSSLSRGVQGETGFSHAGRHEIPFPITTNSNLTSRFHWSDLLGLKQKTVPNGDSAIRMPPRAGLAPITRVRRLECQSTDHVGADADWGILNRIGMPVFLPCSWESAMAGSRIRHGSKPIQLNTVT